MLPTDSRVLGLDPGSRSTGWGLVEGSSRTARVLGFGCIHPTRSASRAVVLLSAASQLADLLAATQPMVVVLETPFAARFPKAALALAEVRGALLVELARWGGTLVEIAPAKVKAAIVGHGRAEKRQVAFIVARQLGLVEPPAADAADALALALCHLRARLP